MPDLTITLIQTALDWEDIDANLKRFDAWLDRAPAATDLVVLPEMFTTGFTMAPAAVAEQMDGRGATWLAQQARRRGVHLAGSLVIRDGGRHYNRLVWAQPDGRTLTYDKRHLFRMAGEHEVYAGGREHLTVTVNGWRIRPFVCYDLRFPGWTRNLGPQYDLALFVANWPAPRAKHWRLLLAARAVENQCWVAGVNRIGSDGNERRYDGQSRIVDPLGEVVLDAGTAAGIHTHTLSAARLAEYREAFPAWKDADLELRRAIPTL